MGEGEFLNSLLLGMLTVAQKENFPLQGCGSVGAHNHYLDVFSCVGN